MEPEDQVATPDENAAASAEADDTDAPNPSEEDPQAEEAEDNQDADTDEGDLEDVDYEGVTYRVPKSLASAIMRQADYTRKTQEVAERARELESREARLSEQAKAQAQMDEEALTLKILDQQLEAFSKVDWAQLERDDPDHAQMLRNQRSDLRDQREDLRQKVGEKQQKQALEAQRAYDKRVEQAHSAMKTQYPEWGRDHVGKLQDWAIKSANLKIEELSEAAADPRFLNLIHLAHIGARAIDKQRASKTASPQSIKPTSRVTAKGGRGTIDPDKLSMDDWVKYREKRLAKRG